MEYQYTDKINVNDFQRLRHQVGWKEIPEDQAQEGLNHTCCSVCCTYGEETVGMARLLWDHGYVAYLSDVIVDEKHRGNGIATTMINIIIDYLHQNSTPGWHIKLFLVAAKGRDTFYQQFQFVSRPNETGGPEMERWFSFK